jgi:Putative adhesin
VSGNPVAFATSVYRRVEGLGDAGATAMMRNRRLTGTLAIVAFALAFCGSLGFSGCAMGPSVSGAFDRSLDVSTPLRLELSTISGDVTITSAADGKVHVHGDVTVSGFGNPQERLKQIVANPPIELKGDTLRVGQTVRHQRNVAISYSLEVPADTFVDTSSVSGAISVRGVQGPVEAVSISGSVRAQDIARDTKLSSKSGELQVQNCGGDVTAQSVSGTVTVTNAKGDVTAQSISGNVTVGRPGGRVDSDSSNGSIQIHGANNDVKAHTASGRVDVGGNPSGNSYWDLKTRSGPVNISVPSDANFHLSSNAVSGQIRTEVPIVIEEQDKHSLRARMGTGGGRVEVHTVSGSIDLNGGR